MKPDTLRRARVELQLTLKEMGRRMGISKQRVYQLEHQSFMYLDTELRYLRALVGKHNDGTSSEPRSGDASGAAAG